MEISERILLLLEENKITAYEVSKNLELSESTFSKWKKHPAVSGPFVSEASSGWKAPAVGLYLPVC